MLSGTTILWFISILSFGACFCDLVQKSPIVTTKQGMLQGSVNQSLDGKTFYSFKGIPFAEPPVGELRFTAPRPPKSWKGARDATAYGPICTQYNVYTGILDGEEDCLFLNVYTKSLRPESKTPVMVFIYGGGFVLGSGNNDVFGPEYFLRHDVIIVTFNYRLEMLGFLGLDTPEVPGNAGMRDQVLALRWVQENIAKFGGDPDNVTIFGKSAGSVSVTFHLISPMSKGLFHKAITQSGVCLNDWGITYEAKERAFKVGKALGKETSDVNELLQFFKSLPAANLTNVGTLAITEEEYLRGLSMYFVPTVEKNIAGVKPFLSEKP